MNLTNNQGGSQDLLTSVIATYRHNGEGLVQDAIIH